MSRQGGQGESLALGAGLRPRFGRPWLSGVVLVFAFVALRLPTLVEPRWYSDEGTYADVGRALLHGAVLYRDVWDNKPPGMYWLSAGVIWVAGVGSRVFPVVMAVVVAAGTAAVWRLGRRNIGLAGATVASLVFVAAASLPNLEGDLLNSEIVGAVLVLWAMVLMTSSAGRRRAIGAGVLVGAACLFKAVFALDVLAVLAVPLWTARSARRSWRDALPVLSATAAGAMAVVVMAAGVLALGGSLGGLVGVLVHQDVSYVQLTNGPGGAVLSTAATGTRLLFTVLLVARLAVPLAGAGVLAWRWSRHGRRWPALVAWWLGCDLAGAMVSARGFSHYAQQAGGAAALAAATLAAVAWRHRPFGRPVGRPLAVAAVLLTWPLLQLALVVPGVEVAVAGHHRSPALESGSFKTSQVGRYYRLSYGRLTGSVTPANFESIFPTDLNLQREVVGVFCRYSRPGDRVFVWGTVHWSYALANRVPAGRYVSLNSAYVVDGGAQARLVGDLRVHPPVVLVADSPLPPAVVDLVRRLHYVPLPGGVGRDAVWLAPWAPNLPPGPPGPPFEPTPSPDSS